MTGFKIGGGEMTIARTDVSDLNGIWKLGVRSSIEKEWLVATGMNWSIMSGAITNGIRLIWARTRLKGAQANNSKCQKQLDHSKYH